MTRVWQKTLILCSILLLTCGCFGKKRKPRKLNLSDDKPQMSMANVSSESGAGRSPKARQVSDTNNTDRKSNKRSTAAKDRRTGISPNMENRCKSIFARFANPYRMLLAQHQDKGSINRNDAAVKMVLQPQSQCEKYGSAVGIMQAIVDGISQHNGKIGLLLPLTGLKSQLGSSLLKGMQTAAEEARIPFDQKFIVKDTMDDPRQTEAILAEMVFTHKVTMVIGGFNTAEANLLVKWSDQLQLPTFIIHRDDSLVANSKQSFRIYPDEFLLAARLAAKAHSRGIKKIAILRPISGKSDNLIESFKFHFTKGGGEIADTLPFTQENFESMDAVSRQLFQIDFVTRRTEYRRAYWRAKRKARAQGLPFDPRLVVLDPIVSVDAIFIPDDFRTVRHFAKLFRYHGVQQLPLIGNHEWRSPALVEPYDDFLQLSLFADFIGSYQDIPTGLIVPLMSSPFFVQPQYVMQVDFQLIGYRAAQVALFSLQGNQKRHKLARYFEQLALPNIRFFPGGKAFDGRHTVFWPTFIFAVNDGSINMLRENQQAAVAPAPAPKKTPAQRKQTALLRSRRSKAQGY